MSNRSRRTESTKQHSKKLTDIGAEMDRVSGYRPLNRASRRRYAKRLLVFKDKYGWLRFNKSYASDYGLQKPYVKYATDNTRSIQAAIER